MTLGQEEQISRYFDHAMSSGEEQNFLITLAASDTMRIAFRSQLELMKAVRNDADRLRSVAAGRTTAVRDRTLTALGLSATAVTPFIEQELMDSQHDTPITPSAPHRASAIGDAAPVRSIFSKPKYALGTGLLLGFMSAVALLNVAGPGTIGAGTHAAVSQRVSPPAVPAVVTESPVQQKAATNTVSETIPTTSDMHKVADERSSAAVTGHAHPMQHHAMQTAVKASETSSPSANSVLPEVSTTNPAKVNLRTKINKPADDRSSAEHSTKAP